MAEDYAKIFKKQYEQLQVGPGAFPNDKKSGTAFFKGIMDRASAFDTEKKSVLDYRLGILNDKIDDKASKVQSVQDIVQAFLTSNSVKELKAKDPELWSAVSEFVAKSQFGIMKMGKSVKRNTQQAFGGAIKQREKKELKDQIRLIKFL